MFVLQNDVKPTRSINNEEESMSKTTTKRFDAEIRIRLKSEQINALQSLAEEREVTVSQLVREAIRAQLDRQGGSGWSSFHCQGSR